MKNKLLTILALSLGVDVASASDFTSETRVYKQPGDRALHLYIEKPAAWQASDQRPAIVFFFGGGWVTGNVNQFQAQSEYLATRGMVGIRVEYRVIPKGDKGPPVVCCRDAKSAMRWVRAHAAELGIDPQRIAASGGSAGGHLAAFATMVEGMDDPADDQRISPKANALVLFNPVFDNGPEGGYGPARIGDRYQEFSPAHNITPATPPTVVFLGDTDRLIGTNVLARFKANMTKAGVRCDTHVYAGQPHGFFNQEPYKSITLIEADKFLGSLGWLKGEPTIAKAAVAPVKQKSAEHKPNIVYVLTDQWRASATGYAGDPNVKTPNLDRLAGESLNLRNAVSVLPVCTPHRAALMTGRFPTSTGMFLNDAHLPGSELCMAEMFGAAGYVSGYIGKWHLDGHGRECYIPPDRRQGWQYWKAAECDHNYNHSHYYTGHSDVKQYWEGYDAFAQTRDAQQYLRDRATNDRPFILMLAYGGPHFPHKTAPEEFKAMYPPEKIQLPPNVPPAMEARARQEVQGYYAHCTALDKCIGDLLGTLAETGLATNTIVVFTSDHGEALGSHGVPPTQKQVAWSESAQVPFLMRVPGIAPRPVTTPITTPDILPTLLGLAGLSRPKTIEGEDLSSLLRAGRDEDRAALYMNVSPFARNVPRAKLSEYRAIRTSRYTYVRGLEGPWVLYDDLKDPYQTNNLIENKSLVSELDARLQAQLKRIGEDFRPGKDYIAEWGYEIAEHGSVPYAATLTKVQTPRRNPASPATKPTPGKPAAN